MTYLDRTLTADPDFLVDRSARVDRRPAPEKAVLQAPPHPGDSHLAPLLSVLFHMIDEVNSIVVNVTAASPGAGASTVACNLAEAATASGWCRVALLDAQPAQYGAGRGLVDQIEQGDIPLLSPRLVGDTEIDMGRLSNSGRPLSRIDSVRRLYGLLRDRYTLVIVDCPAVFVGQQTLTVAAAADETVLVIEAERTALAEVMRARMVLERRGAGVLGVVMNKSRSRRSGLFGGKA